MQKTITPALLVYGLLVATASNAALVTIDFDSLASGEIVTDQFASDGVTFALLGSAPTAGPVVVTPTLTNYPEASAPNMIAPDDDATDPFFDVEMSFSTPIDFFRMDTFDADEPLTVNAFLGAVLVDSVTFLAGTNFQHYDITLGSIGGTDLFDRVVLDVTEGTAGGFAGGPEFFDNLQFNQTPEPATLLLLAAGAGILVTRRRP